MPYTQVQLLDQALDKIKKTGLYTNVVMAWNAKAPTDKMYRNAKEHFVAAYDAHLKSAPTANTAGHHGAAATAALSGDDSLESISNSIAQMQMANNAGIRAINDSMATANAELRQALIATQQQVAALARAVNSTHAPAQMQHRP